jgi:HD-GYP domain-containing protein (c-di-GMP phosphodiesterase class II)
MAAQTIAASIRAHDLLCRAGADEFALMLPETDPAGAMACLTRILKTLEVLDAPPISGLSVSVGLAGYARDSSAEGAFAAAGEALDGAREAGGGRIEVAGVSDGQAGEASDAAVALMAALDERDSWTAAHSRTVADMAAIVAQKMGLQAEVEAVRTAALLHDVGKLAVPEMLLNKPAPLDDAEWSLMRDVPLAGERILRAVPGLGSVARLVRHVHEQIDGSGYPDGLKGEEIPIGSRVIAACDAYHAMTTPRPFRPVMGHERAVHELIAEAGNQFDDEVTEILIGYVNGLRQSAAWQPQAG